MIPICNNLAGQSTQTKIPATEVIANQETISDDVVIKIGVQETQNSCLIARIFGTPVGFTNSLVLIDNLGIL
jgi:hypothetical protein